MTTRGRMWLTDAEEPELRDRVLEVGRGYRGRNGREHPEGARPWNVYALVLPAEDDAPTGDGP